PLPQAGLDHLRPLHPLQLGDLGEAVSRQVAEADRVLAPARLQLQVEEIQPPRATRRGGDARQSLLLREAVDHRRLADVRAADEGHLRKWFPRPLLPLRGALDELGSEHAHLSCPQRFPPVPQGPPCPDPGFGASASPAASPPARARSPGSSPGKAFPSSTPTGSLARRWRRVVRRSCASPSAGPRRFATAEIGRASCRERLMYVSIAVILVTTIKVVASTMI